MGGGWPTPRHATHRAALLPIWTGFEPRTVQPVVCRYTDYAIPASFEQQTKKFRTKLKI